MATHALRPVSSLGARQHVKRGDRDADAKRSIKTRLRFESLENRIVLSAANLSSSAALQMIRDMQAAMDARSAAEVSSAEPAASALSATVQAFGSRCNYEWVDDTPHGCYRDTWCEPEPECDPYPNCDPVPLRTNGENCETPCEPQVPSIAEQGCDPVPRCEAEQRCETDWGCESEMRREWCEREEWCEERPRCEERPPCDSGPTVVSYERCEERPKCEVRRECDPYQNGAKSTRGKEYCDPCENSDVRRKGAREQSCEVEQRCETKQRCDTKPRCDDNVPASAARESSTKQSGAPSAASTTQQGESNVAQRVAQAVEKCFGDTKFMNQVAHLR